MASPKSEHPDYWGAQDAFYVGNVKGVGRIYQQTFIDIYAKVGFAKQYDRKTPITAAELLNDRVLLPFCDSHEIELLRVLTDRAASITATRSGTNTSYVLRSKTSTTTARTPRAHGPLTPAKTGDRNEDP
jgi:hypothetical protein